ncbi:TPA: peptidase M56 BlaR1 [Elizabethkingia anophelis]|uniref:M56 family metallopeptidase n=2 Tax=Elizabethkingia anophelis TaxID=1117645 RepID=UPI0004029AC4|nr:M56 family metallopeptidase [Elizabethkingia anophelis]MCT3745779.1 peptidase M56 BlaR1 [Elizabethkingia anophelis]MDV3492570.1 peptidase M56 BlaR1 [Elizabethkingia anophelis]MDV4131683.1 peptidase M56 BlaR1 [Elizabethkingia anophelis]MDV4133605.1 peptidase M56 BlaR1 [Elizabethkingia anophelis]OPC61749.1 peptidase M56 BlaR1 [Elizabethkingia anophelis]
MDSSKIILLLGISFLCWLIYKLVLADHKLFVFNRFFLLGAVVISLIVPFVQIDIAQENNLVTRTVNLYYIQEVIIGTAPQSSFNWYKLIVYSYIAITTFFIIRFILSILQIAHRIYKNENKTVDNIHYVLLDNKQIPYCFLNYIFVPREDFINRNIESEILQHEQAHLFQKHTLDIIFIQLVLAFTWFNPFFWLIKQSITANHEFLADEHTLRLSKDIQHYRKLIISKTMAPYHNQFASNFNFLLTKKRFIMMTKQTSKNKVRILKLSGAALLIAATAFGISMNAKEKESITTSLTAKLDEISDSALALAISKSDTTKQERKAIISKKIEELNADTAIKRAEIIKKYNKSGELKNSDFPPAPPVPPTPPAAPPAPPTPPKAPISPDAYAKVDKEASFPDGIESFRNLFTQNFDNSKVDGKGTIKTTASYIIDKDGNVKNIVVVGPNESFNTEVKRTIETIVTKKKWVPAQLNGQNIASLFRFPITMAFEETKKL